MPRVSLIDNKTSEIQVFEVDEGDVLFDALDNKGHQLPHGCLAGSCGACRIEIIEGEENLKKPSAVEENTIQAIKEMYERRNGKGSLNGRTIRLACRARVIGDIKVTAIK